MLKSKASAKAEIIVRCKNHWMVAIIPELIGVFFLILALRFLVKGQFLNALYMIIPILICAFIVFLMLVSQSIYMTKSAIIGRKGLIQTVKMVSPINQIQDISIGNGLIGKIFKYYTVTVSTAGSGGVEYVFRYVKNAPQLQQAFIACAGMN